MTANEKTGKAKENTLDRFIFVKVPRTLLLAFVVAGAGAARMRAEDRKPHEPKTPVFQTYMDFGETLMNDAWRIFGSLKNSFRASVQDDGENFKLVQYKGEVNENIQRLRVRTH